MEKEECCTIPEERDICTCLANDSLDIVSKKWTILIIELLKKHGKLRYNEIKKKLNGISPKSLSDQLKNLENADLIKKKIFQETPVKVEYSLTAKGKGLGNSIQPLIEWSSKNNNLIKF
jgi:DNA-binding HxlR family transcriptional regulator